MTGQQERQEITFVEEKPIDYKAILRSGAAVTFTWKELEKIVDACIDQRLPSPIVKRIQTIYRYGRLKCAYQPNEKTTLTAK